DQALRICRGIARNDDDVALVFAQLGERRLRQGLAALLDRRLVAPEALRRYLTLGPRDLTAASLCRTAAERFRDTLLLVTGGVAAFLDDGPVRDAGFAMLAADARALCTGAPLAFPSRQEQAQFRVLADRLRAYFLKADGEPRGDRFAGTGFTARDCDSEAAWKRHRAAAAAIAPAIAETVRAFRRDLNVMMSRGVWRVFAVALSTYQRTLENRALLDFAGVLERAVGLLQDMDEFAQSRFRLESRYRHVLVDEFQDTSRAQWQLVSQLVRNWGEGFGAAADALAPSIFIVGDRKQSIYGFRDADVSVLDDAVGFVAALRPDVDPRQAISVSFRAAPDLLAFVNDVFAAVEKVPERADRFRYDAHDHFPVDPGEPSRGAGGDGDAGMPDEAAADARRIGLLVGESSTAAAVAVASEIAGLIGRVSVRDRLSGTPRPARASDIAVLFRSRDAHREYERAIERHGVATYVYKGLGFFEADEIQDAVALLRYLANPLSDLRAAAFLRSRVVRLSDPALCALAPRLADALLNPALPPGAERLGDEDRRVLHLVRESVPRWLSWVDRVPPADLLSRVVRETAYLHELRGSRYRQARENLKKLRAMVRRFQNRGYATLARLADHVDRLAVGDESNAAIDAQDAVSLMTVHASKGLEFPIVFVVNMGRGTGTARAPIRIAANAAGSPSVAIADYQSEADQDSVAREKEETKRLLYVALTRARDRLYLSGAVARGAFRATRGSLAEVLPEGLRAAFVGAAVDPSGAAWTGPSGRIHPLNGTVHAHAAPIG
ncbi:MAG: UvrD-helicase domain-containing protein, partial [Vicinamibacterales bacterium]